MTPRPFQLNIDQDALDDLHRRLAQARFPDQAPDAPWAYGSDVGYMRDIADYWRRDFDWRAQEARLNAFPQFKVQMPDIDLHYLHVPGNGPNPTPLLLLHGWPGSVFEFLELIPRLTDPVAFGGRPEQAFTVVAPSLPGFGLSFEPGQKRFSAQAMADICATLMQDIAGYPQFIAQGGDWGAIVSTLLGQRFPDATRAIHLNFMPLRRDLIPADALNDRDRQYLNELQIFLKEETGYQLIQGTRPQTLAFGLTDSPLGLAAWIIEKFRIWSDCGGRIENSLDRDTVLANISLYWFTGAIGSSFWPYYARLHDGWPVGPENPVTVPMGYCQFPKEILRPPRSLAEPVFTNIVRWVEMERGGHFAALEHPKELAAEIHGFASQLPR